jgi:hypothetical protein
VREALQSKALKPMGGGKQREWPKVTKMLPSGRNEAGRSGREEIDRIQRGDDLTTDEQLLQIIAVA